MERARGAVLGEGGSEVDLRRLFTLNKKIASYFVMLSATKDLCIPMPQAFLPRRELADRRLCPNTEETPWETGHRYRARNCIVVRFAQDDSCITYPGALVNLASTSNFFVAAPESIERVASGTASAM